MTGEAVPLVMIPRFTSYVGEGTYTTVPLDVTEFSKARLTFWRGPLVGGAASTPFDARFQTSHDADTWTDQGSVYTATNTSDFVELDLPRRWLRVRVALTADASDVVAITCWATGNLERRTE